MSKKYLPLLSGLGYSSIFGFSFMFTKNALEEIAPFHLLAFRFTIAALFLSILWLLGTIKLNYKNKDIKILILLAITQPVLYFIFETNGINRTTSSEAGLIISLIPVVVTILAAIFLNEKPSRKQLLFILLSVLGVLFIVLMKGTLNVNSNYLGMLLLGGAVLSGAFYNILSRKSSINFNPLEITFVMMWTGAIVFNLFILINLDFNLNNYFSPFLNLNLVIPVIYLSILSSITAFFLLNYTLSRITAFEAAVFTNLVTVISIFAGIIFRNEPFYWFQIVGAIMIILGVWGTNYLGKVKKQAEEITS